MGTSCSVVVIGVVNVFSFRGADRRPDDGDDLPSDVSLFRKTTCKAVLRIFPVAAVAVVDLEETDSVLR